jgi:hypothetical protein
MPMAAPKSKQQSERDKTFAKGGQTRMLPKQSAGPQKPAATGHAVKGGAPGAKSSRGGPPQRGVSLSVPAKAGATGNVPTGRKGR